MTFAGGLLFELIRSIPKCTSFKESSLYSKLTSIVANTTSLTPEQKNEIKRLDGEISELEKTLEEKIAQYYQNQGIDYTGKDIQRQKALQSMKGMDDTKSIIDSLANLKRQKLEIQKQAKTIEKLLEEMIEETRPKRSNSLERVNAQTQETQAKQKKMTS